MSKVTQVTVRYGRSVQPKPYESKEALIEAVIVADEGESVSQNEGEVVFGNLVNDVHAALGIGVGNSVEEPAKKTRKTRTKKTDKAALEAAEEATAAPVVSDDVPIEGESEPQGGYTPGEEVRVDEDTNSEGIDDTDLQGIASRAAAKHGAAVIKDLMKEFGIARLGEMSQDQRVSFKEKVEGLGG